MAMLLFKKCLGASFKRGWKVLQRESERRREKCLHNVIVTVRRNSLRKLDWVSGLLCKDIMQGKLHVSEKQMFGRTESLTGINFIFRRQRTQTSLHSG